jgi:predicted HicB family RNase H-like nuclease
MGTLHYKNFVAVVEFSGDDDEFYGYTINTSDEIVFSGQSAVDLRKNFQEAVEAHIENCRALGISPARPYSGRITYRTKPEQHARLVLAAHKAGKATLNTWIDEVLNKETSKILEGRV